MLYLIIILSFAGLISCGVKGKKLSVDRYDDIVIIRNVESCTPLLKPGSMRPSVCGKCSFSTTAGQLIVKKRVYCPKYTAWKCRLKDGREFVINNLGCEGSIRFK